MQQQNEIKRKLQAFRDKKVAVIGMGISNIPVIRFLTGLGAKITAYDRKSREAFPETCSALENMGVSLHLGEDYLAFLTRDSYDFVVRTPGIRPDTKEVKMALERGAQLTSEIELVFDLCPCPIVGISGSDGKTTSTTLVAKMLEATGKKVYLGGNIGTPLIERVLEMKAEDIVVLELSSFQLMTMRQSPECALLTNISPNHLDYHHSYQEYIDAKQAIFKYQNATDTAVFNIDNEETKQAAQLAKGRVLYFSRKQKVSQGAYLAGEKLVLRTEKDELVIASKQELQLLGVHNIENMLGAACLAYAAGASLAAIREVAISFKGVEHRLEKVRVLNGITFYNDTIASSPTRAIAGLHAMTKPVILIAGGSDKYIPFTEFGLEIVAHVKALIVLGATAEKIKQATLAAMHQTGKRLPIKNASSLEEAVKLGYTLAAEGDVVLLSPACASFDMFKNFSERGRLFKQYVMEL